MNPPEQLPGKPARHKKPGPKRKEGKSLGIYKTGVKRRNKYTREFKMRVAAWIEDRNNWVEDHQIPRTRLLQGLHWDGNLRPPTIKEAAAQFDINTTTVHRAWKERDRIIYDQPTHSYKHFVTSRECWPELELSLFQKFQKRREAAQSVTMSWFKQNAISLFKEIYPDKLRDVSCCGLYSNSVKLTCVVHLFDGLVYKLPTAVPYCSARNNKTGTKITCGSY